MPDDLHQSQEPGEERILPAEWLRRLSQRREREGLERSAAEGGDPAAELVRKHLRDDVARVRADLDAMLSEVGEPAPPQPAVPASDAGQPLSPRQHEELRGEFKRRLRKSEKRIRKSLRKQAEAAGRKGAREAVEAASRSLEQQLQAAEEELREKLHAQLSDAVEQARRQGRADAREDLERILERLLAGLQDPGGPAGR